MNFFEYIKILQFRSQEFQFLALNAKTTVTGKNKKSFFSASFLILQVTELV